MSDEKKPAGKGKRGVGDSGVLYGFGFIGAAFYFIQHADSFWSVVLGLLQAVFWPAVLVYRTLELLKM
jgi:hypothetical protein